MKRIFIFLFCCFSITSFGQHPTNLYCSNITSDAVYCHWTNNGCVNLLKYRAIDSNSNGTWSSNIPNVPNPFLLNNLQSSTNYEWKVKCNGISGWSNSSFFTTLDSAICNFTTTTTSSNTTCNDSYNGSATINIINGVNPFSYIWNTGDTTSSLNNIQSGSYIVSSTDSSGCSVIDTILVSSDNLISFSQSITPFIDTTNPNYPNTVQAHNIWVFDTLTLINNGCGLNIRPEFTISHQDSIIQQGQIKIHWKSPWGFQNIPYTINSNGDAHGFWNTAYSDSTGIIATMYSTNEIILRVQFTNQAPYGEYTALWDTKEVDSLGNILQTVTPYDTATLTLVDCNSLVAHKSHSDISCWGDSNGIASIDSITNGSGNYGYNWINDTIPGTILSTTASVQNLLTGNYSCTIIDSSWGCSIIESFTITEPAPLNIIETTIDVMCYGDSNGVATLGINGGTNPYGEGWYGESTDSLKAGIWFYYVTDANNCTFSDSVIISQPPQLISGIMSTDITNCISNNGTIDLNPNGGTGILSFSWSNGSASEDLSNLSPGTYYVTISDTNNCSIIDSAIINDYTSLISTTLSSPNFNGYNIQCFGDTNGTITSNTNGGVGLLSYLWSDGQTSSTASNLSAGIYTLTVTDSLGCTASDSITLTEPNELTSSYTQTNVSCFGANDGSAIVNFFGGIIGTVPGDTNYILGWDGFTTVLLNPVDTFATVLVSPSGVPAGIYPYSATDLNGCTIYDTITITEPDILQLSNITIDSACYQVCDGELSVTIEGGTSPYDTEWSLGGNIFNTTDTITEDTLCPGNYQLVFTDVNNCSDTVIIPLIERDSFVVQDWIIDDSCYNSCTGQITVQLMNQDNPPFTYNWSNGGNDTVISNLCSDTFELVIIDERSCSDTFELFVAPGDSIYFDTVVVTHNNCYGETSGAISLINFNGGIYPLDYLWSNSETTSGINSLASGLYNVTITDANGCSIDYSNIEVSQPDELTSSYTQTNSSCFGVNDGSAIVNFFGGTTGTIPGDTNYILGWDGFTTVLLNPITEFQTAVVSPSGVPAGVYPYSATDLNGCTIYDTITITETDSLYTAYSTTNYNGFEISCNGLNDGEINIQINGGTSPFDNYLNGILQSNLISNNLAPGTYFDSIIDVNGCIATNTIILNEPTDLISALTPLNSSCNGLCSGEITSNTSGGVFPYSYSWTSIQDTTADVSNLCAGYYSLSVTDANGCIENLSTTITEPNAITISLDSTSNISTYGGNDGYIYISSSGGSGQLSTSWSSNNGFSSNNEDISNLSAGVYYLAITDSNSCTFLDTFELSQPTSLWIILDNVINANCFGDCNGSINITANGGDSTYLYSWVGPNGFSSNNDDISNLCYGEYIITINDSISILVDTFNVYQPQLLTSTLTADSILCHNGTAQAEINVWGGTQPFTYNWSNGDNNYYTTLSSGSHSIIVTDTNGCTLSQSFSLSNPDSIFADTTVINTNCFGNNNGSISVNVTNGGTAPFTFSVNNGITYQNSNTFNNLSSGSYSFLISDSNSCLGSTYADVTEPPAITSSTTTIDASCYGDCDGSVSATAIGGTPPYIYNWNSGTNNLCAGLYNVVISDSNGCIISNSAIVNEPAPLLINVWINGNNLVATSGFTSYQWYYAVGTPVWGETLEVFNPSMMGDYFVVVNDSNGCSSNSYVIAYNISSIENYSLNTKIFPNPTKGHVTISSEYGITSFSVFNAIGNQLLVVNNNNSTKTDAEIDLSTFAKGVYFIKITINNQIINQRIILQ